MVSKVWNFFTKSGDFATCKSCQKRLKCKGGCTSSLKSHLKTQHNIIDHQIGKFFFAMRQQIIKTCKNFTEEVEIESDCEISVKNQKLIH